MAGKKRNSGKAFRTAMVLYAVVVLIAGVAGLRWLYGFLAAYQASYDRAQTLGEASVEGSDSSVLSEFVNSFSAVNVRSCPAVQEYVSTLDANLMDPDSYLDIIAKQAEGELSLNALPSMSNGMNAVYAVMVDGTQIGTVRFEKTKELDYGFKTWQYASENYDFSYLERECSISVPEGYSVSAYGKTLDASYIVNEEKMPQLSASEKYAPDNFIVPLLITYSVRSIDNVVFTVSDGSGDKMGENEDPVEHFLNNCSESERKEITDFANMFLAKYKEFTTGKNYYSWYNELLNISVPHSDFAQRINAALEGYRLTKARTADMSTVIIYHIFKLDENTYFCDVTYTLTTNDTINEEPLVTDYDVRLVLNRTPSLRISAMPSN